MGKLKECKEYGEGEFDHIDIVYKYPSLVASRQDQILKVAWYPTANELKQLNRILLKKWSKTY